MNDLVSHHIVLMRTNTINLLNRVPEHDSLTFFVLHRIKCKWMGAFLSVFRAAQNETQTNAFWMGAFLWHNPNPNHNPQATNSVQASLILPYMIFRVSWTHVSNSFFQIQNRLVVTANQTCLSPPSISVRYLFLDLVYYQNLAFSNLTEAHFME